MAQCWHGQRSGFDAFPKWSCFAPTKFTQFQASSLWTLAPGSLAAPRPHPWRWIDKAVWPAPGWPYFPQLEGLNTTWSFNLRFVSWVKGIIIQDLNGIYPFLLEGAPKQRLGGAVDHHEKIGNPNPPVDGYPIFFLCWAGTSVEGWFFKVGSLIDVDLVRGGQCLKGIWVGYCWYFERLNFCEFPSVMFLYYKMLCSYFASIWKNPQAKKKQLTF